jgi:hypothetical protein
MNDPLGRHRADPAGLRPAEPIATVSVLDLFARVVEIQVALGAINERLSDIPDHESRIRLLERFRYTLAGLSIIGGGFAGYIGYLLATITGHH